MSIIKSLLEKAMKRRSTSRSGLSERGRKVEMPQQRRVEAVFSVLFGHSFVVEKEEYTTAYVGVNGFE